MKGIENKLSLLLYNQKIIKKEDIDIFNYGLEIFIFSSLQVLSILGISIFADNFIETLLFFISFIPLRIFAGGYHADTKLRCYGVSLIVYIIFSIAIKYIPQYVHMQLYIFEMIFSLIIVLICSPVIHINKSISNTEMYQYRKISIFICLIQIILTVVLIIIFKSNKFITAIIFGQLAETLSIIAAKIKEQLKTNK